MCATTRRMANFSKLNSNNYAFQIQTFLMEWCEMEHTSSVNVGVTDLNYKLSLPFRHFVRKETLAATFTMIVIKEQDV